jgi:hypothetical protein
MKRIISTLFGLAMLCLFAEAQAVPATVSFTGRLSTSTGPVSGAVTVTFSLFNQATNGTVMWTETRNLTATAAGLVYADLGSMTTLDEGILTDAPLFLEIQVGSEVLTPRLPLQSVPYAIRAETANILGGTVTADEVVTAATAPIAITTGTASLVTCGASQIYKMSGGTWQCAADTDTNTTYSAGANGGLALNGTAFGLTTCTTGQVLKSTGAGTWGCAADTDTNTSYTPVANGGVAISGTTVGLTTCAVGQVLKSTGTGTYGCAADNDAGGDITGVTASTGLSGGGTSGTVTLSVNTAVIQQRVTSSCAVGSAIRAIAADGTVTCQAASGPIAYGDVSAAGARSGGTTNWTVTWNASLLRYEIAITGESYLFSSYTTVVTPVSSGILCDEGSISGMLVVNCQNTAGTGVQSAFNFVTFQ